MKDYFTILGLKPGCSESDIRRAYRSKAKTFHPDRVGEEGTARFLALKEAYEVLISPMTRESYNISRRSARENPGNWNYRDFLEEHKDEPDFLAKLICFDLLHDQDAEALQLLEEAEQGGFFSLRHYLDREDFMDYTFLLAEAYLEQGSVVKAYRLLRGIAELEEEDPYFKHFYVEVLDRMESIVKNPLPEDPGNNLRTVMISDLVNFSYPPKTEARLRKILSELLTAAGYHDAAAKEIFRAWKLSPKLPGLAESVKILQGLGINLED